MKKLISLMLVLSLAAFVSAATVRIDVDGAAWDGGDVLYGSTITVTWNEAVSGFGGFGDFKFNVSDGAYVAGSLWVQPAGWILAPISSVTPGALGFDVTIAASGFPSPTGDIFTFDFIAPSYDTTVSLGQVLGSWNGNFQGPGTVMLNVVPEPMTIALLGLGGLFIRRRK